MRAFIAAEPEPISELYVIRDAHGRLLRSLLTGRPLVLSKALADETRADVDLEDRKNAPHRVEQLSKEQADELQAAHNT